MKNDGSGWRVEKDLDLRCYFVTGVAEDPRTIVDIAVAAARGGAGVIQVRSKPISARELYTLTKRIAEAVADLATEVGNNTKVLVDDRADIARCLRDEGVPVHGVHLGQDDLPVRSARQLLGDDAIIGLTTGTLDLIRHANDDADVLDYVGCGPFRATPTKDSGRPPLGLSGYAPIVAESRLPVVAIGDVTCDDAADLAATGVAGVAIVRGIVHAADPEDYTRRVLRNVTRGVERQL